MSYCRIGRDSDVYCWQSVQGFYEVYISPLRLAFREFMEPGNQTVLTPLPYDGQTFMEPSPQACMERLKELKQLGYVVPEYALKDLRKEIRIRK